MTPHLNSRPSIVVICILFGESNALFDCKQETRKALIQFLTVSGVTFCRNQLSLLCTRKMARRGKRKQPAEEESSGRNRRARGSETNEAANRPTILTLDVGGITYRISRSLLDQYPDTMLSRMASETWHKNPGETIFVERDGRRFAFVLDFMRDAKVSFPAGVPNSGITKSSILDELSYFGFVNVDEGCVQADFQEFQGAKYIAQITEGFEKEQSELIEERDQLNVKIAAVTVAHAVAIRRMGSGTARIEFNIADESTGTSTTSGYARSYGGTGTPLVIQQEGPKNFLDFQAIHAIQATSLQYNHVGVLNTSLAKYGLTVVDNTYHETYGCCQSHQEPSSQKVYKVTMEVVSI